MKFGMKNNGRIQDTQVFFFLSSVKRVVVSVIRRIEDYKSTR